MNILVTGGSGFIGSHIVDALVQRGDTVTVLDLECAQNETFYKNPQAMYLKNDVLDFEAVSAACTGKEAVFHLAGESRVQPSVTNPRKSCETNIIGTCNVLQAAHAAGVKAVINSSTSACYGLKNRPPLREEMVRDNLNAYALSKAAGEDLCRMFSQLYALPTISLRYFNVFGDRMPHSGPYAPVVAIFQRQLMRGQPLTVIGDGRQRRDFVHVSDIVQANLLALQHAQRCSGKVYNVGSGRSISVLEIAKLFNEPIAFISPRPGEARDSQASLDAIRRDLGFNPRIDIIEWLAERLRGEATLSHAALRARPAAA